MPCFTCRPKCVDEETDACRAAAQTRPMMQMHHEMGFDCFNRQMSEAFLEGIEE
jgi:hypothetical protein